MPKEVIHSRVPSFSLGTMAEGFVFLSGRGPTDPKTGQTPTDIREQLKQVMTNIRTTLESVGGSLEDVLKVTIWMKNIADFKAVTEEFVKFFKEGNAPARTCIQVTLPPGPYLLEIETIAYIGKKK